MNLRRQQIPVTNVAELAEQLDMVADRLAMRAGLHVDAPLLPERASEWSEIVRRAHDYIIANASASTRFRARRGLRTGAKS